MNNLLKWIKDNPIRSMFLVPIFLVAGISISHVVAWYDITNPFSWAIYLSVAVEIGAITALIAATQKIKGGVWFMFGLVTFVQLVGNVFYSYKEIDPNGDLFKSWVELTSPIFEIFGTEPTDIIAHKRWLAILGGGLLPIISLTSLHFFVKYEPTEKPKEKDDIITELFDLEPKIEEPIKEEVIESKDEEIVIIPLEPIKEEIIEPKVEEIIEPKVEEKPKSNRGRKKKVVEEIKVEEIKVEEEPIEEFVLTEITTGTTTLPIDNIIINEIMEKPNFIEPQRKSNKLTYTKSNVTIGRI